jgi:threonyl-tRNA synthetase
LTEQEHLDLLRRSAAEILAAAIYKLYPNITFLGGGETQVGFYYDFVFPHPFSDDILHVIEKKMKDICKKAYTIETKQMIGSNAKLFFNHHGHCPKRLNGYEKFLVSIFLMDDFMDMSEGEHIPKSDLLHFFKLIDIQKKEKNIIRITGTAHLDKKKLQDQYKKFVSYRKNNHLIIGKKLSFLTENEKNILLLPTGTKAKEIIKYFIQNLLEKTGFVFVETPNFSRKKMEIRESKKYFHLNLIEEKKYKEIAEIYPYSGNQDNIENLLETKNFLTSQEHILCSDEDMLEKTISSLQFISKILNIFDFISSIRFVYPEDKKSDCFRSVNEIIEKALSSCKFKYSFKKKKGSKIPRVEFYVEDELGKKWLVSYIEISLFSQKKDRYIIEKSTIYSFERVIALLLEKERENSFKLLMNLCRKNNIGMYIEN